MPAPTSTVMPTQSPAPPWKLQSAHRKGIDRLESSKSAQAPEEPPRHCCRFLDPRRSEYVFSDVSDLFLTRAREKFASFPFASFATFDLEKDLEAQGFALHSFDVIVGANVVHAARDLDGALKRISLLLAPGGILLLIEATRHHEWFDFTTGLIEGWQHFADDLRIDNPLLTPEQWKGALSERGFCEVMAFPESGSPGEVLGQHVILARTPPSETQGGFERGSFATLPAGDRTPDVRLPDGVANSAERIREFRNSLELALPDEREELHERIRPRPGDGSAPDGRGPSPEPPAATDGFRVGLADGGSIAQSAAIGTWTGSFVTSYSDV